MLDLTEIKSDNILSPFFCKNPSFDLQTFNFYDVKVVKELNWEGLDKDKICDRLKAYQRLLLLGVDPSDAKKLLETPVFAASQGGGQSKASHCDSALAIASLSQEEFIKVSNLPSEKAREIHQSATQKTDGSMVLLANVMQFSSPRFGTMLSDNASQVRQNFQSLPSYQELFGSLDYLQCDPCQSIFSPAAYFVDLMRLVDQYITQPNQIPEGNKLSDRRPDLENIPLTCDNTNDTVPYTQIVSEVLANKLKEELKEDVFQHLATKAKYPHNLPFNLYLEQTRIYLGHLNINLAAIYQTFHPQDPYSTIWAREYLGLSLEEYNLITTANTRDLSDRYGVDVSQPNFGGLNKKETFLKQTGLSWQKLNDLIYQNLSEEEKKQGTIRHEFYINKNLPENQYIDLDLDKTEIKNLTLEVLDRVDRFLRLVRKLGWSFAELDWVLTSIQAKDINEEAIKRIAKIKLLQLQTKLPLDVLCSFWYDMKTTGKGNKENRPQDLFNRVFNNHLILQGREALTPEGNDKKNKHDLLAALQLSDRDFTDICQEISIILEDKQDVSVLSKLFRISTILKVLKLKLDEYKLLLQFLKQPIKLTDDLKLDSLIEIVELASWVKESSFSLYELDYIINGNIRPFVDFFLPESKMADFMESLWQKVKLPNDNSKLKFTDEEKALITTVNTNFDSLSDRYKFPLLIADSQGLIKILSKKETFLKQTGLSCQELNNLIYQNLSEEEQRQESIRHEFYINKKLPKTQYVDLDRGEIKNLTPEVLDRVDRFLRLARKLDWSFADLDWVLAAIRAEDINEAILEKTIQIKQLQTQTKLPLDVLCSFWNDIKTIGQGSDSKNPQDLFYRTFNKNFQDKKQYAPNQGNGKIEQPENKVRLLEALGLSDRELAVIAKEISGENNELELNLANLSKLFRISQLFKLLGLNLDKFKALLPFLDQSWKSDKKIEIETLIHLIDKSKLNEQIASNFGIKPELFSVLAHLAVQIVEIDVKADYIKLLLTKVVKDKGSDNWQKIVDFLQLISRMLLLVNKLGLTEAEVQSISDRPEAYNVTALVNIKNLVNKINILPEIIENIIELLDVVSKIDIIKNMIPIGIFENLKEELGKLEITIKTKSDILRFIFQFLEKLDITSIKLFKLTVSDIKNISDLKKQLFPVFNQFLEEPTNYFEQPSKETLSKITGWKQEQIDEVNNKILILQTISNSESINNPKQLDAKISTFLEEKGIHQKQTNKTNKLTRAKNTLLYDSIEGLLKLKQCFDLCANIGCDIDWLWNLCELQKKSAVNDNNWNDYKQAANSAIALVKAKYNDEDWMKVFSKLNGMLEERKCKILTEFALWKLGMENPRQLSEHLLLDVEMTSCACNSRIQLAILSLQTYLQRCRMGIEPEITKVEIPTVWWEWIMNYRIWEANRKVFLYPENYIDPSLRKSASPIFKELQDELLQSEITSETVEVAYRNYFDKFAEIARLQIVDSCRYSVQTPKSPTSIDTLFIFAKTITQPHTFYYRCCEQPAANKPFWGYWEKIDLQINSEYLAPVYAFNRLFVFWVETKEIKEQNEITTSKKKSITKATIKYSFLTTSHKWIPPQTLVAEVSIDSQTDSKDSNFWQQIYPIVVPNPSSQSGLIATVFGGLYALPLNRFDEMVGSFFDLRNKILHQASPNKEQEEKQHVGNHQNEKELDFKKLAATISSDLLPTNTPFLQNDYYLHLSQERQSLAATTVWNLAIFAGGISDKTKVSCNNVDVFEYKDEKLTRKETLQLSKGRSDLAATTVGDFAIFAGGISGGSHSNCVDVFEYKDGKLSLNTSLNLKLSKERSNLAATTIENLALFAGGYDVRFQPPSQRTIIQHREIDVFEYKDGNLSLNTVLILQLSEGRSNLAAATIGNFAIFAGGDNKSGKSDKVDVFEYKDGKLSLNTSLKFQLSEGRSNLAAATIGNFVIFAGGDNGSGKSDKVDVFEYKYKNGNPSLILLNQASPFRLSETRNNLAGTTVGNLAIFASGKTADVFYIPDPSFGNLPFKYNELSPSIKKQYFVTPIKNQSQGFILQNRNEAFLDLSPSNQLTRLTTSAVHEFSCALFAKGLDGLLSLESQQISELPFLHVLHVSTTKLDFDGAYGAYFWEIFFHIPFLIASTLNAHQRYNEARQWYQYIFNPTIPGNGNDKEGFWRFLPFRGNTPEKLKDILTNQAAIQAYKDNPFDPYAIARLRIGAYEKAVVMKYIDNLLNWGDALFTQDNWESITQATTLYLLAYDLLGSKPKNVGKPPAPEPKTFAQIKLGEKRDISDFLIDLENRPEYQEFIKQFGDAVPFNALDAYFCVSENPQFAEYWDRVEDRLFKIRHCQNIKGIERQLALFQPPLDPMQLVRQSAAGDGAIALSIAENIPHYRFLHLLERAKGMASTVIQLGSTLLNTLEKKDAEELALLRATQEPLLLQLITKTKEKQIEEANANLTSLQKSLQATSDRSQYYQGLIDEGWNLWEIATVAFMGEALDFQIAATDVRTEAISAYLVPNIYGMADGGMQFGDAVNMGATILDGVASIFNQGASLASTVAQFQRRAEEWELQQKMAEWDLEQIQSQIEAAQVRVDLANAELEVHNKSIEQSREIEQFFKDKFTNKELYQWMVGRLSSLYFQTYQIALAMAYSAQKAYQYELNKDDSYLQPTYWDSNKKGLLAGESLMLGLNQLEKAYLDGNARRLEIEKIISLRQFLGNDIFNKNKNEGTWIFSLTQKDFDDDFSGHYCRQIKTISVTIPAVVGPYQTIKATLTQTSNTVVIDTQGTERKDWRNNQQIAISKGVNDSGLFVLNFQDERYLPFEGTGAISTWTLAIPKTTNTEIDFNSITDVIITLSYTALQR